MRRCRICGSFRLKKIFSLGKQPFANNLLDEPSEVKTYPLDLYECQHCGLIQLGYVAKKEDLFDKYLYVPSGSKTQLEHFDKLAIQLIKELGLKQKDLVVDIGSSDGSLLKSFQIRGLKVVGIEPAKNISSKVTRIEGYFDQAMSNRVVNQYGRAKLVTATNVFAHIDNLHEFLDALDILLAKDGVFFAQFPDVRNLFQENQFDTIYHEHLSYFTYEPLHHLFARSKFELYKLDSNQVHGGSMQIFVRRRRFSPELLQLEAEGIKSQLYNYLSMKRSEGAVIVAYGAAAKGTVLLNYCELDDYIIQYAVDSIPMKQGKVIPGVNIPIFPEETLIKNPPDVVLILAWNFKDEIKAKLKKMGIKCIVVVPIPELEITSV